MSTRENGKGNGAEAHDWGSPRSAKRFSSLRELSVTYEGHSEVIATRPPDISTRGMFINTTKTFPEGAVLNVRFRLAISGYEVRSRAEVRYCLPGVGVGVEFIDIAREHVRAIEKEIEVRNESAKK
jgi:PilZ domain-containing protein